VPLTYDMMLPQVNGHAEKCLQMETFLPGKAEACRRGASSIPGLSLRL
jgi:hypothetical protein